MLLGADALRLHLKERRRSNQQRDLRHASRRSSLKVCWAGCSVSAVTCFFLMRWSSEGFDPDFTPRYACKTVQSAEHAMKALLHAHTWGVTTTSTAVDPLLLLKMLHLEGWAQEVQQRYQVFFYGPAPLSWFGEGCLHMLDCCCVSPLVQVSRNWWTRSPLDQVCSPNAAGSPEIT